MPSIDAALDTYAIINSLSGRELAKKWHLVPDIRRINGARHGVLIKNRLTLGAITAVHPRHHNNSPS